VAVHADAGCPSGVGTWEYDGSDWTRAGPSPVADRVLHALAFHPDLGAMVMFGGFDSTNGDRNDTWLWDGSTWTRVATTNAPSPRRAAHMAYDAWRDRLVLYGGADASTVFDDTWEFDAELLDWIPRPTADLPPASSSGAMVFHAAAQRCFLLPWTGVAGFGETWSYGPIAQAARTSLGGGCAGSAGVPFLEVIEAGGPWEGENWEVELMNAPPGAVWALAFGLDNSSFGGLPLPLDLSILGMTGCVAEANLNVFATPGPLPFLVQVGIPVTPSRVGLVFRNQAWIIDVPANPFGVTLSDAIEARVGAK
jgi:hypothetical protein